MIYFDNNATTRVAPEVVSAMLPYLDGRYGNPSSSHALGRDARRAVREAREMVAGLLGAADPDEIVFTSGGTESDNWAILGALDTTGNHHIVTTTVEHEAVRKLCERLEREGRSVSWIEVDDDGSLDLDALASSLRPDTKVVSVMMANNETGIQFPLYKISEIVKARSNALIHVDAVNAAGKVLIDMSASVIDLLSISGHKFYGPKGIGALYIRSGVTLAALQNGGGQEAGRRPGTEAVHQIAGIGAAAKLAADLRPMARVRELRDKLENGILETVPNSRINGTRDQKCRLPNTASISFENTNGEMIMAALDEAGVCVSTGSACNDQDRRASAVLTAMNVPYSWAMGSIRFSLGRNNTEPEIDEVIGVLPGIIQRLSRLAR